MDKTEVGLRHISRHISQLRVLARLFEHEVDTAKGKEVTLDRDIAESMLDMLEIFVEDFEEERSTKDRTRGSDKSTVSRLN